ncbi:MAG: glycosyltransferase family 1 protein [Terracidiphilus sp.]
MKILISAASFPSSISGLQRHGLNLARCLLERPEISALHLVVSPWQADFLPAAGLVARDRLSTHIAEMNHSSLSRNLWHYRRLPALAAALGADLVHLTFPMPVHAARFCCPTVVTLHDMYPYEIPLNFGFPKFIFNRVTLRQCLRNADAIACVSEATSRRLRQYAPMIAWRKSIRIYNCVEPAPLCAIQSPIRGWQGQSFLLCVAQHRRNKNIPLMIAAFARLLRSGRMDSGSMLVVVGIAGPESGHIRRFISSRGLSRRIHLLEGLSDSELAWCYKRCEALVAPSITEGFGLPVAEALLAGGRVVCSDIPAFREVGGELCRYVTLDKNPEEALADAISAALKEPKKPPVSLPQFSSPVLAGLYIGLYRGLMASYAASRNAGRSASMRAASWEGHTL